MVYSYEAKDGGGRTVTGSLEAEDERSAAYLVREQGYYLMRLAETATQAATMPPAQEQQTAAPPNGAVGVTQQPAYFNSTGPQVQMPYAQRPMTLGRLLMEKLVLQVFPGVNDRDLSIFYRQFATLLNAGVPLKQTFDALSAQSSNPVLRKCMFGIWAHIASGGSISEGMALYPWIFKESQRALVVVGEMTGNLDVMFRRISEFLEQSYTFKKTMIKDLTEPLITFSMVFLLPPLWMLVVMGNFHAYYDEAILPLIQIVGTVLTLYVGGKLISQVRSVTDFVIAHIPVVGGLTRYVALARFARTLSIMYGAGVNMATTIRYSAEACGNAWMAERMASALPMMEAGHGVVESLIRTRVFPPMVLSMMSVGETTGSIDIMMDKVAYHFEEESALRMHQLTVAVRTIATIAIGIKVCIILIKFYTGYFGGMLNSIDTSGN